MRSARRSNGRAVTDHRVAGLVSLTCSVPDGLLSLLDWCPAAPDLCRGASARAEGLRGCGREPWVGEALYCPPAPRQPGSSLVIRAPRGVALSARGVAPLVRRTLIPLGAVVAVYTPCCPCDRLYRPIATARRPAGGPRSAASNGPRDDRRLLTRRGLLRPRATAAGISFPTRSANSTMRGFLRHGTASLLDMRGSRERGSPNAFRLGATRHDAASPGCSGCPTCARCLAVWLRSRRADARAAAETPGLRPSAPRRPARDRPRGLIRGRRVARHPRTASVETAAVAS